MYHLAAAAIGILVYSMLVSPLSPATHSVMGDWQALEGAPMVPASVAAAWILRRLILCRGWLGLVVGGACCALLTGVFYSSAILILEGIHGESSPSGIAMGGLMGLYYGPVFFGLSAHVSVPAGILGAAVLRHAARDAGQHAAAGGEPRQTQPRDQEHSHAARA
jgi:hypothetical protein